MIEKKAKIKLKINKKAFLVRFCDCKLTRVIFNKISIFIKSKTKGHYVVKQHQQATIITLTQATLYSKTCYIYTYSKTWL